MYLLPGGNEQQQNKQLGMYLGVYPLFLTLVSVAGMYPILGIT